jgi:hypothetical protein
MELTPYDAKIATATAQEINLAFADLYAFNGTNEAEFEALKADVFSRLGAAFKFRDSRSPAVRAEVARLCAEDTKKYKGQAI